ncbi:MAG: hypothetical protein ACP5NW_02145 [Candidatus Woesearchaeota archaeon]
MKQTTLNYETTNGTNELYGTNLTEKIHHTLSALYNNKDGKLTFAELKNKDAEPGVNILERTGCITKSIDMIEIIKNSQYERVRSYQLTPKGRKIIERFYNNDKKYGRTLSEAIMSFQMLLTDPQK